MFSSWFGSPTTKWVKARDKYLISSLPEELRVIAASPDLTPSRDIKDLDILVVDFETSGFDAQHDHILSMGWVVIERGVIRLNTARHLLIKDSGELPSSEAVKIHQLLPETLDKKGIPLASAFHQLFSVMAGKVILAHGTVMEARFFNQYIQSRYQLSPLPVAWIDTLQIEKARSRIIRQNSNENDWRLGPTRERYGLPQYTAHNALVDAIATAELYLAQLKVIFGHDRCDFEMLFNLSHA